jgi:flavin-dependent dehydrogenase
VRHRPWNSGKSSRDRRLVKNAISLVGVYSMVFRSGLLFGAAAGLVLALGGTGSGEAGAISPAS